MKLYVLLFTFLTSIFHYPNPTYLVTQVLDGDTFLLDNLFYIRLTNIDAPGAGNCLYEESKKFLSDMIMGKRLRITSNTPSSDGRILAQAYLGDKYINLEMVRSGYARYTSGAYDRHEEIQKISSENKSKKFGVYSEQCLQKVNAENPECVIKGNLKEGVKTYMYPGCGTYSSVEIRTGEGDRWFCTEEEAVNSGFAKAENCYQKYLDQ